MPETTPLIKAALNLRGGAGFDVYFPCILTHCLINGLSAIFVFNYSLLSCCITLIVTIIVSILILNINKRYIR